MDKRILIFVIASLALIIPVAALSNSPPVPLGIGRNIVTVTTESIQKETLLDNGEILILPSKKKPFNRDYRPPNLIKILKNNDGPIPCLYDIHIAEDIYQSLLQLMAYVNSNSGCQLVVSSVYRSYKHQESLFRDKVNRTMMLHPELNNDVAKAEQLTESLLARPGTSQHMTGRAIDFTTQALYQEYLTQGGTADPMQKERYHYLREAFINTREGQLLIQNAYKFGFIMPFPKGKENLTGYKHEPWHYLYVKKPHAELIYKGKWTLPEYFTFLQGSGELYYKLESNGDILKYCLSNDHHAIEVFLLELRNQY